MRPLNRLDAINLHKAEAVDDVQKVVFRLPPRRRMGQQMALHKQAAGGAVWDARRHDREGSGGRVGRLCGLLQNDRLGCPLLPFCVVYYQVRHFVWRRRALVLPWGARLYPWQFFT